MSVLSVEQYREIRNILIQAPTDDILRSGISPSRINLEYIGLGL